MKTRFVFWIYLLLIIGCEKDDVYKQNQELKSNLQGSWILEVGNSNTTIYRLIELEFIANNMRWYDSLVTGTYTERTSGSNPVVYSFNDSIVPIDYGGATGHLYLQFDVNNVLWVDWGKHQTDVYNMDTLTFSSDMTISVQHPIRSSAVEFDSSFNVVEFCHPSWGAIECYTFHRVD